MDERAVALAKGTIFITNEDQSYRGTAFYILPGLALTCHHVIDSTQNLKAVYNDKNYEFSVLSKNPSMDLALINLCTEEYICLQVGKQIELEDECYAHGYSIPGGNGVSLKVNGFRKNHTEVTLTGENVAPGMSGSPVLSLSTLKIIGVLAEARRVPSMQERPLGGTAILMKSALHFLNQQDTKSKLIQSIISSGNILSIGNLRPSQDGVLLADLNSCNNRSIMSYQGSPHDLAIHWLKRVHWTFDAIDSHAVQSTIKDIIEVLPHFPSLLNNYSSNSFEGRLLTRYTDDVYKHKADPDVCMRLFAYLCSGNQLVLKPVLKNSRIIRFHKYLIEELEKEIFSTKILGSCKESKS